MLKVCCQYLELNIPNLLVVYEDSLKEFDGSRFQAEQDLCDYLREDFFSIPGAYYALWCQEDRYACALRMEPYYDGFLISGLETSPDSRRKGYGEALVKSVCKRTSPVYAHVRKSNHASIALHRKCGFQQILDYGILLDGTISYRYVTMRYPE